jgi:hypothetical protein
MDIIEFILVAYLPVLIMPWVIAGWFPAWDFGRLNKVLLATILTLVVYMLWFIFVDKWLYTGSHIQLYNDEWWGLWIVMPFMVVGNYLLYSGGKSIRGKVKVVLSGLKIFFGVVFWITAGSIIFIIAAIASGL